MRLEGFIKEFYPEWYGIQTYPADKTVAFFKVAGECHMYDQDFLCYEKEL